MDQPLLTVNPLENIHVKEEISLSHIESLEDLSNVCRTCAAVSESMVPIFEGEGLYHSLADKMLQYLSIKVHESEELPRWVCASCAGALVAWHRRAQACARADRLLRARLISIQSPQCTQHATTDEPVKQELNGQHVEEDDHSEWCGAACGYCGRTPPSPQHLVRAHADRLFHCDECDAYLDCADLISHMASHAVGIAAPAPAFSDTDDGFGPLPDSVFEAIEDSQEASPPPLPDLDSPPPPAPDLDTTPPLIIGSRAPTRLPHSKPSQPSALHPELLPPPVAHSEPSPPPVPQSELPPPSVTDAEQLPPPAFHSEPPLSPAPSSPPPTFELPPSPGFHSKPPPPPVPHSEPSPLPAPHSEPPPHLAPGSLAQPASALAESSRQSKKIRTCGVCGKTFSAKSSYFYHVKHVHGDGTNKRYECGVCGLQFGTRAYLANHGTVHTGERPFACARCGKLFRTNASLHIHAKTHSDRRPFACERCPRAFRCRQKLVRHEARHAAERSHACTACGRRFTMHYDLLRHERTHAAPQRHACARCGAVYAQRRYLRVHCNKKHPADPGALTPAPAPSPQPPHQPDR